MENPGKSYENLGSHGNIWDFFLIHGVFNVKIIYKWGALEPCLRCVA